MPTPASAPTIRGIAEGELAAASLDDELVADMAVAEAKRLGEPDAHAILDRAAPAHRVRQAAATPVAHPLMLRGAAHREDALGAIGLARAHILAHVLVARIPPQQADRGDDGLGDAVDRQLDRAIPGLVVQAGRGKHLR